MKFDIGNLTIREAEVNDLQDVLEVERLAFGEEAEADLVKKMLQDKSAQPVLSLLAFYKEKAVGHLVYTKAHVDDYSDANIYILAPLAVIPAFQKRGIGKKLMEYGDKILMAWKTDIVFVLGHPSYYPKFGFTKDAEIRGYPPPFPILPKNADAWMFKYLSDYGFEEVKGKLSCCDALNKAEYWKE